MGWGLGSLRPSEGAGASSPCRGLGQSPNRKGGIDGNLMKRDGKPRVGWSSPPEGRYARKTQLSRGTVSCFEWMESLSMAVIAVVLIFTFLIRVVTVSGASMEPTLFSGDKLLVSSFFYQPQQGDVVVLRRTSGLAKPIVKRVIALPGQTVDIDYETGTVLVDGEPLEEPYLHGELTLRPLTSEPLLEFPQTVPEGHIFVLGDNRDVSEDSRFVSVGMVDQRYIFGKAEWIVFPFDRIERVE